MCYVVIFVNVRRYAFERYDGDGVRFFRDARLFDVYDVYDYVVFEYLCCCIYIMFC